MVKEGFRLSFLLATAKLSRATYYYQLKQLDKPDKDQELKAEIQLIYDEHKGNYGYRRIHLELKNRGFHINHKKVQRLMQVMGLQARIRRQRKYSSYKGEIGKKAENLIQRQFEGSRPYEKCYTDVTEFALPNVNGKLYLSPILDMHTNEIIAYDLARRSNLEQIKRMLTHAFRKCHELKGLIMHSDQGWQYQHRYYRETLKAHGITQSMSRKGNCYDNCIMETFFGRMKNEMYYGCEKQYQSFEAFSQAVKEYIHYYNHVRIQKKTKWMPPVTYRKASMCW